MLEIQQKPVKLHKNLCIHSCYNVNKGTSCCKQECIPVGYVQSAAVAFCLGVGCLRGGVSAQAGCLPKGCPSRGVCPRRGGCLPRVVSAGGGGCLPSGGVCPGGVCLGGCLLAGGVCLPGRVST